MSRTIKEIYNQAVLERNKRMELKEFSSDSKLSILNGITWAFAAVIFTFETILDVFAIDISNTLNSRINGTPNYYANALLQYQKGDSLVVREDGLAFGYANIDETKRIITQVSYSESTEDINLDSKLILKVATGEKGNLSAIPQDELHLIRAYIQKLTFAGTRVEVTSRNGDVLIPRISVYYDGAVMESEIYDSIESQLNEYIMNINQKAIPEQGIFIAFYDADGNLSSPKKIERMTHTSSGYIKQSTGKDKEADLPNFKQAIKLIIDTGCDTDCQLTD